MGRGRAKAKQAKVARELKYQSPNTDLEALERELSSDHGDNGDGEDRFEDLYDSDPYDDEEDGEPER